MTKYRKLRQAAANVMLKIIFTGSGFNVKVKLWLWSALDFNLWVWRKMALWSMRLYVWLLPGNGNGENGSQM